MDTGVSNDETSNHDASNQVTVNPGDDVYLAKSLEEAIAGDDRTAELGVQVEVRGGVAVLRGTVASDRRKEAVTIVAAEHAPKHAIANEIVVRDPSESAQSPESAEETVQ